MRNSEALVNQVRELAGTMSGKLIAQELGVSHSVVAGVARRNKISLSMHRAYDKNDDETIKKYLSTLSYQEIGQILKRSADSVRMRAALIGLAGQDKRKPQVNTGDHKMEKGAKRTTIPWSSEDLDFVIEHVDVQERSYAYVAKILGRTEDAVRYQYKELHKSKDLKVPASKKVRNQKEWREEEVNYLLARMNQPNFCLEKESKRLMRTFESVRHKYRILKGASQY